MSPEEIVGIYVRAWSEPDATHRGHLLQQCWTEDGIYCDPRVQWRGREALNTGISDFQQRLPGTTFRLTGPIEVHHDVLRFRWSMHRADGSVALMGTDFGELAEDGRLRRITGFFNQAGAAPIVWDTDRPRCSVACHPLRTARPKSTDGPWRKTDALSEHELHRS